MRTITFTALAGVALFSFCLVAQNQYRPRMTEEEANEFLGIKDPEVKPISNYDREINRARTPFMIDAVRIENNSYSAVCVQATEIPATIDHWRPVKAVRLHLPSLEDPVTIDYTEIPDLTNVLNVVISTNKTLSSTQVIRYVTQNGLVMVAGNPKTVFMKFVAADQFKSTREFDTSSLTQLRDLMMQARAKLDMEK